MERPFLTVLPIKDEGYLEVHANVRYALLPDFFGYDVVYNPNRITSSLLNVPAENFLILLLDGNHSMVMCVWQGNLAETLWEKSKRVQDGEKGEPLVKPSIWWQ